MLLAERGSVRWEMNPGTALRASCEGGTSSSFDVNIWFPPFVIARLVRATQLAREKWVTRIKRVMTEGRTQLFG